jgi:hypothetical protein
MLVDHNLEGWNLEPTQAYECSKSTQAIDPSGKKNFHNIYTMPMIRASEIHDAVHQR